ncbi:MAG: hypothetical protein JSU72_03905 [Deltaproteobacteria bacterium]|nr:MAG: hypothetical protein JSU72_03905 [Deltaproteobacteria bacterium]
MTTDYGAIQFTAWVGLAWMVLLTSVVMMLFWIVPLRYLGPVEVAICTNAQPPTTAALSALMAGAGLLSGDQDLGPLFWIGMVIVLIGVFLVHFNEGPTEPSELEVPG